MGARIGRLRGAVTPGEQSAFGHAFERRELEALAHEIGRDVLWEGSAGTYPHVTLVRRS